mmetsp:Transcript_15677/g.13379  ORF Transcript_15677/g.13379 Transcript_15677/m.13379 type:complete len:86 (-) Transcript_15677:568-825(-)
MFNEKNFANTGMQSLKGGFSSTQERSGTLNRVMNKQVLSEINSQIYKNHPNIVDEDEDSSVESSDIEDRKTPEIKKNYNQSNDQS